jgi:hypothetical protein
VDAFVWLDPYGVPGCVRLSEESVRRSVEVRHDMPFVRCGGKILPATLTYDDGKAKPKRRKGVR